MIKIGTFAHFSQVSIAALRHYDDIGLLKPALIDNFTGYRYYSVSQLPRLNRILALKDLGFSLEQIAEVLNGGLTLDELRGMLKMKHAEMEQKMAIEQERLSRIASRLKLIELENTMSNYEVILKTVSPMLVAAYKVTIPTNDQVPAYLGPAFAEIYNHIRKAGAKDNSPCLAVWHQPSTVYVNEVAEAIVPIDRVIPGTEHVKIYELPQTQVASVVHHGNFDEFTQGHTALLQWVEANNYRIVGPYREIYLYHDHSNMQESTTEIQFPIEKA